MRPTKSTSLGFGMVIIPVKLYKLTDDRALAKDIHQVHAECGSRIKAPKWCPTCDRALETSELQRGYFYEKDRYVSLTDQDYERLPLSSLKSIQIESFIEPIQDHRWFNGGIYALAPDEVGVKAFVLFTKAMGDLGCWGIAKMATREKEQLVAIMPAGNILFLQTLHWGNELRDYGDLVPYADVSDKEMNMAKSLIGAMKGPVDLHSYRDEYTQALKDLIVAKLEGREIERPPEVKKPEGDLTDMLMASLAALAKE